MEIKLPDGVRRVVLVEGQSDRNALLALADRRRVDLAGVEILAMGGATNIGHYVPALLGHGVEIGGLYDAAEERFFSRGLRGVDQTGFFVCVENLEDELIRALGVDRVLEVIEGQGEADKFATFQNQPFQREREVTAQLERFIGTMSGRKIAYGRALVEALDGVAPAPLEGVLAWATRP